MGEENLNEDWQELEMQYFDVMIEQTLEKPYQKEIRIYPDGTEREIHIYSISDGDRVIYGYDEVIVEIYPGRKDSISVSNKYGEKII